jgi:hypothetical protein
VRELVIRRGSLAAMVVLGTGLIISTLSGLPPWGTDEPVVRFLVVLLGISLPAFEFLLPWLRARRPDAFPTPVRRWSRSALWGAFFIGAGVLALPDWLFAAGTLIATGLIYLLEAWAIRTSPEGAATG